ncbi:MAG: polysaccharide deacetylase family protein [Ruminococcus sp.]|uniref:polysaccharide deacetylase family protein n=1 Tax=Ruminococcus sp. TaxID=41978 RepID=UPI002872F81A|nr:polysaccharide deacetylase family protein [Ruminococcus sp.]MBQ3284655.1 polysaccharide deacetylase family protein [Ruminococcus sp.]
MSFMILTRRKLTILFSCVLIGVLAIAVASSTSGRIASTAAEPREIPIYYVDTQEKVCALSFDAAWGNEQTATLLDILDDYEVKSTFFLVGDWVENYPDDVKEIAARGHDVGNHSATHPHMAQLGSNEQCKEIDACNAAVKELTDRSPTLFRAPYGEYDNKLVNNLKARDMYCVQWNIDSLDWKDPSPDEMVSRIQSKLCPGSVILMHNGAKNTPEALPKIIEMIQGEGYTIVPISQLIPEGDYYTDHEGKMILTEKE